MNRSWYTFFGLKMGMSKQETMLTPYGEMQDLIACSQIDEGRAEPLGKNTFTDMATALLLE